MSHPQSYEILLVPEYADASGADKPGPVKMGEYERDEPPRPGSAIRSGVVEATGATGASGYPRYAGDGIEADIDPATRTVEALLIDGAEIDYGLSVRVADRAPAPGDRPAGGGAEG
ncbi:hypothetical protein OG599_32235 [Streptomyces sp. NBC_01335]|uniref:hypothetical protein n=1 Tax=Streptomyces sp. NBC_01335 TaxID=2903828 RepID=UPI002E10E6A2|nr:hypothetical protein OG599_32235 [Streptomyces sp. NBC_01335]